MRARLVIYSVLSLAIVGVLIARPSDSLEDAEKALKDRDYKKAVELFRKAHDEAKEGRDRILYLLATAHQHAGEHDAGIAVCDRLVREHPSSPWVFKAHFKKGDLLAAKKEHELAARLFEERTKAVASPERRKPLAMIYVTAAREFLAPKEPNDPSFTPNYVAAHRLLTKSLELEALGTDEESVRFDALTCEFKAGFDRNQLLKSCDTWLEKFPKGAKIDDVRLTRGRALAQLGRWWEARKTWLQVPKAEALWEIAQIEPGPRGLAALREIVAKYATSEIAPTAAMNLADRLSAYEDLRAEAIAAYRDVAAKFPKHANAGTAVIRAGELEAADDRLDDAIATYDGFLKTFTENPRWEEVRRRISDLRFLKGYRAFLRKDYAQARTLFADFLAQYPVDPRGADIALLSGDMLREEKKLREAVDQYRRAVARYPSAVRAWLSSGEILEELEEFDAAIQEFQKGGHGNKVAELRGKTLYLESERVFTTTEAPTAKLTARNFQKIQFKLWTLDLKDYFEKKLSTAGLHAVEVAVIAPDHEWEVEVKDWKKHKKHVFPIPLPVKSSGAYIVQAKAENLEATTVVLVSDLAFIAKAGRHGITLLAQDMRRGEALDTAPFRASADGKMLKDGKAFPPEILPSRLSVLAEVLGNFAFRDFDVSALPAQMKRGPVALILSDRGAYAAEDTVQLRIVIRDAVDNAWIVPKDKTYRLTAVATNGATLWERDLKLSAQGTATESFPIWTQMRLEVHEIAKPTPKLIGSTQILLGSVARKATRFDFLMEDKTYFFGDEVDLAIVLRDASGRPIRNRKFRYHLAGSAEWKDAVTDANGGFALKLTETEQFERTGCFVETQFGEVRDVHAIAMSPRTFVIAIEPATRPTEPIFVGESKTIVYSIKDHPGQKVAWEVTRSNEAGEKIYVARGETTAGSFAFTPTAGGLHSIILRARDAEGMPVRASTAVFVSDDQDPTMLRILSEKDSILWNQPLAITVHSRLDRTPAYVVVENEKVELVKRVTLEKGKNAITLDLGGRYSRSFRVSVLAMKGNQFHTSQREFRMTRAAELEVKADKETYKPGDEVKLSVRANRHAEIWVQVAEHVTTWIDPNAVDPYLCGPYFVTDASNTVAFTGVTAQVSKELEDALARLENLDRQSNRVMMDSEPEEEFSHREKKAEDKAFKGWGEYDTTGGGGGGGGRYGSRLGGKKNLVQGQAHPRPIYLVTAMTDAKGEATFTFRLPRENGQYTARVYAIDASNAIDAQSVEVKARGETTVEIAVPESMLDGDQTTASVFVTNHTGKPVTTEYGVVPARSVAEFQVAAKDVKVRPSGALRVALGAGSSFTIGDGTPVSLHVDIASSSEERLRRLAAMRDVWTPEADLAVRVLAKEPEAEHRLALTPHRNDLPTEVLRYIALKKNASMLKSMFAQAPTDDQKALILFALSYTGDANSAYVNRLARSADTLTPRAMILTALLLHRADRKDEAKALLAKVKSEEPAKLTYPDWSNTAAAIRAMLAIAAAEIDPSRAVDLDSIAPATAFERGMLALATKTQAGAAMTLKVNGKDVKPGEIDPAILVKGAQKIEVAGGHAIARLVYRGEAKAPELKIDAKRTTGWPSLEVDGDPVASPTVTTGTPKEVASMAKTAAGAVFPITIEYTITEGEPHLYVLEETLPAGVQVISSSGEGRIADGRIQILVARTTGEQKIRVSLTCLAVAPGAYSAGVLTVRRLTEADSTSVSGPAAFAVLKPGEMYRQGYEPTPGELFSIGRHSFAKKDWRKAKEPLAKLFEQPLADATAVEVARMLAYISIELGENDGTVRYFEILKEKLPGEIVPFDKILAVGRAYLALREFDRARQVFAGTCDAYFLQEANLVGELEGLGRTRPASEAMMSLLRAHPDTDLNREMHLGLGQQLLSRAKAMRDPIEKDPLRYSRREMLTLAASTLEDYLALFPADKACDQASLVLGTAYLEATENAKAEASGRASAARYPKSRYLDTFDYIQAIALFAQKKFDEALAMCDRLETHDYGRDSNPGPEIMKSLATLMKAQIYHAKGDLDKALASYKAVRDKYPDAARALAFLEREAISMPEVTTLSASQANEIEVEYSGVPEAQVKAYKVNLTMLFLKYKGVRDASQIEIAGIRPAFEKTYALQGAGAKRRQKQKLALDLKDTGAYLVSVKAGDFFAAGLVLKSDLSMSVQEEEANGTVRVNVANSSSGRFEEGVKVTFIGSADQGFKSEKTDLRGIAEAEGLRGYAMVIAEKSNHYAFYRGTTALSGYRQPKTEPNVSRDKEKNALEDSLKELEDNNRRYQDNYNKKQQGVEVQRTK